MHTKRILIFATVCLVISAISMAGIFAEESVITLGGKNGWSRIQKMDGLVIGSGRYGYDCIQLDTNNRNVSDGTDLLLDFEDEPFADIAGNYNTAENNLLLSTSAKI